MADKQIIKKLEERLLAARKENDALRKKFHHGQPDCKAESATCARHRDRNECYSIAEGLAHLGSWSWNIETGDIYWSDEFFRILGFECGEIKPSAEAYRKLIHPDDLQKERHVSEFALARPGNVYDIEHRIIRSDGSERVLHSSGKVIRWRRDGRPLLMVGASLDITEQQIALEEQKLNEERLQGLVELHGMRNVSEQDLTDFALEEAVRLTRSRGGYFHLVDDEATLILNSWSRETLNICKAQQPIHYPLEKAGVWADCIRLRKPVVHNDFQTLTGKKGYPAGHFPVCRHMGVPIFDGGKIVAVVGVGNKKEPYDSSDIRQLMLFFSSMWDIIKQRRADEQRRGLEVQLRQARKLEAVGTLAGGIAHDFNNTLAIIQGYADLVQESISDNHLRGQLDKVIKAGDRAKDLVRQILTFSRQTEPVFKEIKLCSIVEEVVEFIGNSLPPAITIESQSKVEGCLVLGDASQMYQVVMNLCTNACHAMEETGGKISVLIEEVMVEQDEVTPGKAEKYLKLVVSDTGSGMDAITRERIFDPYFTTKRQGLGSGLGLAVVHGIVQVHNGLISVASDRNRGTSFEILFPAVEGNIESREKDAELMLYGNERVLFVEDDEVLAQLSGEILESLGYKVRICKNGAEALELFDQNPQQFDLIITDQSMPEISGSELAKAALAIRPEIPIILLTGFSNLISKEKAEAIGIRAFAMKPMRKNALGALIRKVLDEQP